MDANSAVDICRSAIWIALTLSVPILLIGALIGLVVGLLQALTQIQEQTIAVVLKLIVMALVIAWLLPGMTSKLVEYSAELIQSIPQKLL